MNNTSWLQRWLESVWYENAKGRFLLLPLSFLFCSISRFRRKKYQKHTAKLSKPVIVVGNISVGGTGKTPLTIYLVKLLQRAGYSPAIITRGYGGKAESWPQAVTAESDPQMVGDEPVLMASQTQVPVYAGPDRLASIAQLLQHHAIDVILSDDGLQHYRLPRDMEIAVLDGSRMLGNGDCLPAGPLREKPQRLDECDFVVVNSRENNFLKEFSEKTDGIQMRLTGTTLVNLQSSETMPLSHLQGQQVHAVTGIGNPERFFQTLESIYLDGNTVKNTNLNKKGLELIKHSFPDHHSFKADDFQFEQNLPIVMTQKDAVKCIQFAGKNFWYLPVIAELQAGFDKQFLARFQAICKQSYL